MRPLRFRDNPERHESVIGWMDGRLRISLFAAHMQVIGGAGLGRGYDFADGKLGTVFLIVLMDRTKIRRAHVTL